MAKPSIHPGESPDEDFVLKNQRSLIRTLLHGPKAVDGIEVWSHSRDIKLWNVINRYHHRSLRNSVAYGQVPPRMRQSFPELGEAPLPIAEGELIIVRIEFLDDYFISPGRGNDTRAFRKTGGVFAEEPLPEDFRDLVFRDHYEMLERIAD